MINLPYPQEYDTSLKYLNNANTITLKYMGKQSLKGAMLSHVIAMTHSSRGDFRLALQCEKEAYLVYKTQVGGFID